MVMVEQEVQVEAVEVAAVEIVALVVQVAGEK
jgi:hypothetical protein